MLSCFSRLLCIPDKDRWYGDRLEIQIAAALIKKKIQFAKSESPDFNIDWEQAKVYIECTSVHFNTPKPTMTGMTRKIDSAIRGKAAKPYSSRATALFIDITNVHAESTDEINLLGADKALNNYLMTSLPNSKYGSILAFTYQFDAQKYQLSCHYIREDDQNIAPALQSFLDANFPKGNDVLYDSTVPFIV